MNRAKITTNSIPKAYKNESQEDIGFKAAIIVEMYYQIPSFTSKKKLLKWIRQNEAMYREYFCIWINKKLNVCDRYNPDEPILIIDMTEMEA